MDKHKMRLIRKARVVEELKVSKTIGKQTVNTPIGRAGWGMVTGPSVAVFLLLAVVGTAFAEPPIILPPSPTNPSPPITMPPTIQPLTGPGPILSAPTAVDAPQAAAPAAASRVGACSAERVATVELVNLQLSQNSIAVSAEGQVSSAGWKDAHLVRAGAADNGHTLVFDFVACPPHGFAAQVMQVVNGRSTVSLSPKVVTRIVVRGRNNSQTVYVRDFR